MKKIPEAAQRLVHKVLPWTLLGFVISLSFPIEINRVFLAGLYGLGFLAAFKNPPQLRTSQRRLLPIAFFLIISVSCLFSTNMQESARVLDKNLPFILLPLFWPYAQRNRLIDCDRLLKFFVVGLIVSSVLLLMIALFKSLVFTDNGISFDSRILRDSRIDFSTSIVWGGNYFFSTGLSLFIHPTYLTMYLTLAIFIITESTTPLLRTRYPGYAAIALFLIMIYLLSSRAGFLVLFVAVLLYLPWKFRANLTRKRLLIAVILFVVAAAALVRINPRLNDLFIKLRTEGVSINPNATYSYESRLLTWFSGIQLIKENAVFGVGAGDIQDVLMAFYKANGFSTCFERKYNVHNQYLETWLATGIPGLVVLLMMFGIPLYWSLRHQKKLLFLFILIVMANCLFESVFDRYYGIVFFTFFYCLFYIQPANQGGETFDS